MKPFAVTDTLSGETIVYQYDVLKRLTSASSTPTTGSSTPAWNEQFSYDGFGNLTGKTLNGTLQSIPVTAATNQLQNATYDANGNTTSGAGAGATAAYNVDNRMMSAQETSGGIEYYFYAPDGKRVWRQLANGTHQFTFYGAYGEQLGVFTDANLTCICGILQMNVSFAGKLIWQGVPGAGATSAVLLDRLGSNRNGARFYPYGDEITSTANDREKFATYTRDSYTGFDYANQRFFASTNGRFNTSDQYMAKAKGANDPATPSSWNRYAYVLGDPVNNADPQGLFVTPCDWDCYGPGGCMPVSIDGVYQPSPCLPTGPAPPAIPPVPICDVDLLSQAAGPTIDPFKHTLLKVVLSDGLTDYLEGIPIPKKSNKSNVITDPMWLNSSRKTTGPYYGNPTSQVQLWLEPDSICYKLISLVVGFVNNKITYNNNNPFNGPNSNSFTHSLLNAVGMSVEGGLSNIKYPGWSNTSVPFGPLP